MAPKADALFLAPAALPLTVPVVLAIVTAALFAYYRSLLKKPLPGIPYNKEAVGTLFGDVPGLLKYKKEHGSGRAWFLEQIKKHNSALVQIFIKPTSPRPAVILSDVCLHLQAREGP